MDFWNINSICMDISRFTYCTYNKCIYIFYISRNVYTTHIPIPSHLHLKLRAYPPHRDFTSLGLSLFLRSSACCDAFLLIFDLVTLDPSLLLQTMTTLDLMIFVWPGWKLKKMVEKGETFGIVSRDGGIGSCPFLVGLLYITFKRGIKGWIHPPVFVMF